MKAVQAIWSGYVRGVAASFEAIPGWHRFERFMDDVADGFVSGLRFLWALRWWWALLAVGLIATGS